MLCAAAKFELLGWSRWLLARLRVQSHTGTPSNPSLQTRASATRVTKSCLWTTPKLRLYYQKHHSPVPPDRSVLDRHSHLL